MSLTSGPINETKQAAKEVTEDAAASFGARAIEAIREAFRCLWKTRVTIDFSQRDG
jgi:hypothetical protein